MNAAREMKGLKFFRYGLAALLWAFGSGTPVCAQIRSHSESQAILRPLPAQAALITERTGAIPTRQDLELRFSADRGNVRVFNDGGDQVRYRARVEAAPQSRQGQEALRRFALQARSTWRGVQIEGRLPAAGESVWAEYEIHVPLHYSVQIFTRAGAIVAPDVKGRVILETGGGSIEAGNIGDFLRAKNEPAASAPPGEIVARLVTGGGRIRVGDVAGSVLASSGGGHIVAGNVFGDATFETRGGEVRAGRIAGSAKISTGGGNVFVESAQKLEAETSAGRIDVAEVSGPLQRRRAGGREELRMEAAAGGLEGAVSEGAEANFAGGDAYRPYNDEELNQESGAEPWDAPMHGALWELSRKIENFWWGAVRVDPAEQEKRLLRAPAPEYPEAARRAGIEGQVTMLVRIGADGKVQDATLIEGEPVLGRAAAHAIEQWQYAPLRIGGRPVNVLTSVTVAFELH